MWQNLFLKSLEQGLAFGIMALGVYITFRILKFSDLTVDGSFPLGAAVAASLITTGQNPFIASAIAMFIGALAGIMTGLLNTKAKISDLLSGILTMTSLYSINLRIMTQPNISLLNKPTIFDSFRNNNLVVFLIIGLGVKFLIDMFLRTQLGLSLRATGDNPIMIRSHGVNTDLTKIIGLAISNGFVAFSGALIAQYQGFADVGMGVGTVVSGLASIIIGESILHQKSLFTSTLAVLLGSFLYRFIISLIIFLDIAQASDLRLLTSLIVIISLILPKFKGKFVVNLKKGDKSVNFKQC